MLLTPKNEKLAPIGVLSVLTRRDFWKKNTSFDQRKTKLKYFFKRYFSLPFSKSEIKTKFSPNLFTNFYFFFPTNDLIHLQIYEQKQNYVHPHFLFTLFVLDWLIRFYILFHLINWLYQDDPVTLSWEGHSNPPSNY